MTVDACPENIRFRPSMLKRAHHLLVVLAIGLCAISSAPGFAASGFSAVAVDAHTGRVLFAQNADAPRYPASLTKVMTLYILFEELKAKRLKLNSPLKCSVHSASRPPSKLGLRAGESVTVEDAIKALVT